MAQQSSPLKPILKRRANEKLHWHTSPQSITLLDIFCKYSQANSACRERLQTTASSALRRQLQKGRWQTRSVTIWGEETHTQSKMLPLSDQLLLLLFVTMVNSNPHPEGTYQADRVLACRCHSPGVFVQDSPKRCCQSTVPCHNWPVTCQQSSLALQRQVQSV